MRTPTRHLAPCLVVAAVTGLCAVQPASAQFNQVWQVGIDNGNNSEFSPENSGKNLAPGSATVLDDDWYIAGVYPEPIGTLTQDESYVNFERALTVSDPDNRIHFNLPANLTLDGTEFRLTLDTTSNNSGVPTNPIPFTVLFNGVQIFSGEVNQTAQLFVIPSFSVGTGLGQVPATTGDNVITFTRASTGAGWMQFDYVRLETTAAIPEPSTGLAISAGAMLLGFARRRRS